MNFKDRILLYDDLKKIKDLNEDVKIFDKLRELSFTFFCRKQLCNTRVTFVCNNYSDVDLYEQAFIFILNLKYKL